MRVGWFGEQSESALQSGSKAAYLSSVLLPLLSRQVEIRRYDEISPREIAKRESASPSDVVLFHIEDRNENRAVREALMGLGGIAWVHDWFERESGEGPSIERCVRVANVSLFSSLRNMEAAGAVKRRYFVPYCASWAVPASWAAPAAPPEMGKLAYCGSPFAEDQAHDILGALAAVSPQTKLLWLVAPNELTEARRLLAEFSDANVELRSGRTPDAWRELLAVSSAALHLHFSGYGDLGPLFAQTMMSGVPAIVTRFGDALELPGDAVVGIDPGVDQRAQLEAVFSDLRSPVLAVAAAAGRACAAEIFDSRLVAAELMGVFESACSGEIRTEAVRADAR